MAHAHCMLNTEGYKYTLTICNTYCFSTATMVARTRHNVTLYAHCLITQVKGLQGAERGAIAADDFRVRKLETITVTCGKY